MFFREKQIYFWSKYVGRKKLFLANKYIFGENLLVKKIIYWSKILFDFIRLIFLFFTPKIAFLQQFFTPNFEFKKTVF